MEGVKCFHRHKLDIRNHVIDHQKYVPICHSSSDEQALKTLGTAANVYTPMLLSGNLEAGKTISKAQEALSYLTFYQPMTH